MSKKIIYLLSLLMALTLVFASCKKNNTTNGLGDIGAPEEEDNTGGVINEDTGLVPDTEIPNLPADKPLKKVTIFKGDANNYLRNPVIVVMGDNRDTPVVFAEKRYNGPGAANDVGIDGKATVDVVYKVGAQSGQNFAAEMKVGPGATDPSDSHGAPVVFRVSANQVVVVASAGAGIARTDQYASQKDDSRVDYIVGTLDGTKFTWDPAWTELKIGEQALLVKIKETLTGNSSDKFEQMGTQAARGYVATDNKTLILPVVMAQQGILNTGVKELMGVYFVKGTWDGSKVTWENVGTDAATYPFNAKSDKNYSQYKESQVIAGDATSIDSITYIAVPSPWGSPKTANFGLGKGKNVEDTGIQGHDGAPGYLALKWYGAEDYKASEYKNQQADKGLFLGVKNDAANITLYLVNKDTVKVEGKAAGFELNAIGKSGSIDVLGDGTVVTAAEEGNNGARNYYTSFTRYSQKYLNTVIGQ